MITLDYSSGSPIYKQIYDKILRLAVIGIFKEGHQLPSVRSLAKELAINPNTVQKAYNNLEADNIIYSVQGKGNFISSYAFKNKMIISESLNKLKQALEDCISCRIKKEDIISIVNDMYDYKEGSKDD